MTTGHYFECPVCGNPVTKNKNGTLQRHKARPRWVGSKKLHNDPPQPWCPGGGIQLAVNQSVILENWLTVWFESNLTWEQFKLATDDDYAQKLLRDLDQAGYIIGRKK